MYNTYTHKSSHSAIYCSAQLQIINRKPPRQAKYCAPHKKYLFPNRTNMDKFLENAYDIRRYWIAYLVSDIGLGA